MVAFDMPNAGKRALLTGGAGIGRAAAQLLRDQGAQVMTVDLKDPGDDPMFVQASYMTGQAIVVDGGLSA